MKTKYLYLLLPLLVIFVGQACKSKGDTADSESPIRSYKNEKLGAPVQGKDHDLELLVRQKMQEVFELSSLRWQTKDDADLDSLLLLQLKSYFDSTSFAYTDIEAALDSSNVFSTRIVNLYEKKDTALADSLQKMVLTVDYLGAKERPIGTRKQEVSFYLKAHETTKDLLFSFYFIDWKDVTEETKED